MDSARIKRLINDAQDRLDAALNLLDGYEDQPDAPGLPPQEDCKWGNGNLWKPKSDTTGNLVVLLRSDWDPVKVCALTADGTAFEWLQYAGRANGDRTHWRGQRPGGRGYANGQQGGGIKVFFDTPAGSDSIFIPLPGRSRMRYGA